MRAAVLVLALAMAGCAVPKAWERGHLANPEMAWEPDPVLALQRNHTYVSKEHSSGTASAGGGGCGCSN